MILSTYPLAQFVIVPLPVLAVNREEDNYARLMAKKLKGAKSVIAGMCKQHCLYLPASSAAADDVVHNACTAAATAAP